MCESLILLVKHQDIAMICDIFYLVINIFISITYSEDVKWMQFSKRRGQRGGYSKIYNGARELTAMKGHRQTALFVISYHHSHFLAVSLDFTAT